MKILIVGTGSVGKRHAINAAKLADTYIYDVRGENYEDLRGLRNIHLLAPDHQFYCEKFDGIVIATPTNTHIEQALRFSKFTKHLLVEKPISNNLDALGTFQQQMKDEGCRVFVVSNMRFHPAIKVLKQLISKIGDVWYSKASFGNYLPSMRANRDYREVYSASRETGGGVILDAIHEIDYLSWILGGVQAVQAAAEKLSDLEIDVEDYASITLFHNRQAVTHIHLDYLRHSKIRGCEFVGADGILEWRSEGKFPEHCVVRNYEKRSNAWTTVFDEPDLDIAQPYEDMMKDFVISISGNASSQQLATLNEGIDNLKLATLAIAAANDGSKKYV